MSNLDRAAAERRWWTLAMVCCAQFIFAVDALAVNVALPAMAGELHASLAQLQAVMAMYFVGCAPDPRGLVDRVFTLIPSSRIMPIQGEQQ